MTWRAMYNRPCVLALSGAYATIRASENLDGAAAADVEWEPPSR
jgi:hypothetical protein